MPARFSLLGLVALLGWSGFATAGVVEFQAGGRCEIPLRIEGETVVLLHPLRPYRFPRGDFRRVDASLEPSQEWPERATRAKKGTPSERLTTVLWAIENGLAREAVPLIVEPVTAQPDARWSRLKRVLESLQNECPDPGRNPGLAMRYGGFRIARSQHFLLLHQHGDDEATQRVAILEDVLLSYYLAFAAAGLELEPPASRQVVVWFARSSDYKAYLRSEGAEAFLGTEGYFHPTKHLVAFYDERSTERAIRLRTTLEFERKRLGLPVSPNLNPGPERDRRLRDIDRRELLEAVRRDEFELGTAAHEVVHQLVRASGLADRHEVFPVWLHEGLAMQFEVVRGGRWAGISQPHLGRLADWAALSDTPGLLPLVRDTGYGRGFDRALYTRAWALTCFLRTRYPEVLVSFIDQLRTPGLGRSSGATRYEEALEAAWGRDLSSLDTEWRQEMSSKARLEVATPVAIRP